jgi:hypothetical protein
MASTALRWLSEHPLANYIGIFRRMISEGGGGGTAISAGFCEIMALDGSYVLSRSWSPDGFHKNN